MTDDVFAVIAEATRRDILVSLRSGDKAVGELVQELEASQPTISKHLKVLREADLVSMRAQGQKRYYALNPKPLAGIASWLETFDVGPAASAAPAASATVSAAAQGQRRESTAREGASQAAAQAAPQPAAVGTPQASQPAQGVALSAPATLDDTVPQQIGRSVGRAATKAADLLAKLPELPKFGRKK